MDTAVLVVGLVVVSVLVVESDPVIESATVQWSDPGVLVVGWWKSVDANLRTMVSAV